MRDLVGVPKGCLFRKQVICERISLTQLVCLDAAFGPYLRVARHSPSVVQYLRYSQFVAKSLL